MSFISILKSIGHGIEAGLGEAAKLEPEISLIPGFGPEAVTILNLILGVEKLFPGSGGGAAKKVLVSSAAQAAHPNLTTDEIGKLIDDLVTLWNDIGGLLGSFHPPATPTVS